jgi:hypothetical protein
VDPHHRSEERSIAMHRAIAAKLRSDPRILERARDRVSGWRADGSVHPTYVAAWERLLRLPLEEVVAALVDPGEQGRALRQVSPFAGALDARERWRILRTVA